MAYTLNRRLAELIDSNGQLNTGKIPNSYITTAHLGTSLTPTFGNTTVGSRLTFSSNSHYLETGTNAVAIKNGSGTVYLNATNTGVTIGNDLTVSGDILKTSGNLLLDVAGNVILDADGSEIIFRDGGTNFGYLQQVSDNFNIIATRQDGDIIFKGNDGGAVITPLILDMSDTGRAKFLYAANIPNLASADGTIQINLNNSGIPTFPSGFTSSAAIVSTVSNSNSLGGTNFTGLISVNGNTLSDTSRNVYTNNLTVAGNLDVQGSTTTLNTATLQVEDKNIVLNYHASNDTSGSADGAGITIQDAISSGNDASLYWRASDDKFIFSHPLRMFGQFELPDNVKMVAGDGNDLQIYHDGANSHIKNITGALKIDSDSSNIYLADGGTDIALLSTNNQDLNIRNLISDKDIYFQGNDGGSTITALTLDMSTGGTAFFADDVRLTDNHAVRLGTDGDIVFYHDNSNGYLENGTGNFIVDSAGDIILDAAGNDVILKDAGTTFGQLTNDSGNLIIYNSGSQMLKGLSTGSNAQFIGSVGIGVTPGSGIQLSIGNNSNNSAITRVTNGTVSVDLTASSSGKAFLEVGTSHPLILATAATERMVIEAGGDVSVKAGKELRLYRSDNATYGSLEYMSGAGGLKLRDVNGDGMTFAGHSGNDYINILGTNGNVGINHGLGGGNMNSKFNVFADGEALRLDGTAATSRTFRFRNTGTNGSSNAIITSDGTLQLKNEDANAAIYMNSIRDMEFQVTSGNGTAGHMRWYSYNTQVMHLDGANNRIGIGTNQPAAPLHVLKSDNDVTLLHLSHSSSNSGTADYAHYGEILIQGSTHCKSGIRAYSNGYQTANSALAFFTNQHGGSYAERMRIVGDGKVGIGTNDPHRRLHVRNASSGGTSTTNSVAVFEDNDNTEVSILGGSSSLLALNFGHSGNNDEFSIKANTTSTDRYMQFDVSTTNVARLDIEGLHFQRADGQKISAKESIVMQVDADNNSASRVFQVIHGNGKTLLNLHDDYRGEYGTIQHAATRTAGYGQSNGLGASAGDWVDIAAVPYGRNIATIKLFWDGVYAPSSSHHGNMEFDIGSHYGTSYYYGWDSYINLKNSSAHNSFHIKEARIISPGGSGATGYFQVKFGVATGTQGTFRSYVTFRDEQCSIDPVNPAVNNSRSGTTIAAVNLESRPGQAASRDFISKGMIRAEGQPGFVARGNTSQWMQGQAAAWATITSGISHGSNGTIGVNLTEGSLSHWNGYDTNSSFNTGTGRFTAPYTGKYHIHGSVYAAKFNTTLSDYMHFNVFVNGQNINQTYTMGGHRKSYNHDFDLKQSTILSLEEGDYVEWRIYATSTDMRIYGDHISLGAHLVS